MMEAQVSQRILVWDVPTRVFHWVLVLSFGGAYWTADSERYRDIHQMLGYTLLGLLAFRVLWGFFGTRYARFHSFLYQPGEVAAYLMSLVRRNPIHYVGHNPAGSLSIWLMLALGLASGMTGVLVFEDVGGDTLVEVHDMVSNLMLVLVGVHLAGVVVSSVLHRENLVRAMVTGFKTGLPEHATNRACHGLGILLLLAVTVFWVLYYSSGG